MSNLIHSAMRFMREWAVGVFAAMTLILSILALSINPHNASISSEAARLQKIIHKRQAILEKFVNQAFELPDTVWMELKEFPSDMVIYRYVADTLQSWANQFPIGNDEIDVDVERTTHTYRPHYLDVQNRFSSPFSYLSVKERFVNVGTSWYVVKKYSRGDQKIIAGLLVRSKQGVSKKLKLAKEMELGLVEDGGDVVISGKNGEPLFTLSEDVSTKQTMNVTTLSWLAVAFAFLTLIVFLNRKKRAWAFGIYFAGITLVSIISCRLGTYVSDSVEFFSPSLYADNAVFSSLGTLLFINLYISLLGIGVYTIRRSFLNFVRHRHGWKKGILIFAVSLIPVAFFCYINFTLRSLVVNSSIVVELYRITELSLYSLLCYVSYALLFFVLMLLCQMCLSMVARVRFLFNKKNTFAYILAVSVYILSTVAYLSFAKEKSWSRLAANRVSVERDLSLELELKAIEAKLAKDPITPVMMTQPSENLKMLEQRFSELYFQNIRQKYIINLTLCRPNESLQMGQMVVDCQGYFDAVLNQHNAVPIADGSNFFYLSNYNDRVGYIGVFHYQTGDNEINLYMTINPRFVDKPAGYPSELSDYSQNSNLSMPANYSFAKYNAGRLIFYDGAYDYPVFLGAIDDGETVMRKESYVHFVHKVSDDDIVVISRPGRTIFPYIVSLSYLILFLCGFFFLALVLRRSGRWMKFSVPKSRKVKRSLRKKMNSLITALLVVSLVAAGMGSVWFSINYYKSNLFSSLDDKIQTVHKAIAQYCTYASSYTDINSNDMFQAMDRLANETRCDINIYDPHGKLIRSTKQELFQKYILSSRMNAAAYSDLIFNTRSQVINKENAGGIDYFSLYSPIFNDNGKLIAIVNIPFFAKYSNLSGDISSVVATIINISILLLILALFLVHAISTSITRPLYQISEKMLAMNISDKPEHINYDKDDDLGSLVASYNKMADSLAEGTRQMAQAEREKAWSDMARRIAHEIKNPLTPMKLSIQRLIHLKARDAEGWQDKFDDISKSILEQIDILSDTASEFSSFAKFYVEDISVINLCDIIKEQQTLFDTNDNVRVLFAHSSEECYVNARKGQIIRVLVNLISNAIQALESSNSQSIGFVRVSLAQDGKFYVISVEDNGNGVKEEDMPKLFTPNFTTKSSGNGLGLAISKSIVEQSGGEIWYSRSELGGADFSFTLPAYVKPLA